MAVIVRAQSSSASTVQPDGHFAASQAVAGISEARSSGLDAEGAKSLGSYGPIRRNISRFAAGDTGIGFAVFSTARNSGEKVMTQLQIDGIVPIIPSPFLSDGSPDWNSLKNLLDFAVGAGVSA